MVLGVGAEDSVRWEENIGGSLLGGNQGVMTVVVINKG